MLRNAKNYTVCYIGKLVKKSYMFIYRSIHLKSTNFETLKTIIVMGLVKLEKNLNFQLQYYNDAKLLLVSDVL